MGRPRAIVLGTVKASNRDTALAVAYDEFRIAPADRKRIVVHQVSDA